MCVVVLVLDRGGPHWTELDQRVCRFSNERGLDHQRTKISVKLQNVSSLMAGSIPNRAPSISRGDPDPMSSRHAPVGLVWAKLDEAGLGWTRQDQPRLQAGLGYTQKGPGWIKLD